MDFWAYIWHALQDPFRYPVDKVERIFIGYLASALLLAIFVYQYLRRHNPDSVPHNIFAYLFPKRIYFHKSALADYRFFLVDRVVFAMMFPIALVFIQPVAGSVQGALNKIFGPIADIWDRDSFWVLGIATLVQVLVVDFALFYVHYLFHKIPALWEFHKVHHSAEVMTPVTAYRMHPVELVLTMNITAVASGLVVGTFGYLSQMPPGQQPELRIWGINLVQFAFYVFGFNLRHSHIPLGYGSVLSQVFVSPWMHQVHHSREERHFDRNMGFIFSFWDRLFGTLHVPQRGEQFELGLSDGEHARFHGVLALYFRPIGNLARRFIRPARVA